MTGVKIITIHYVDNIGGSLLAYALQESVERLGYACEIIDYDPTPVPSDLALWSTTLLRRLRKVPQYLRDLPSYVRLLRTGTYSLRPAKHAHGSVGHRDRAFREFQKRHFHISTLRYTSAAELQRTPPTADAYICGSDQIWNPFMCRGGREPVVDPAYFLAFAPEGKRIAYAPSVAIPEIPVHLWSEFKARARGIDVLSCRESDGARLIANATGRAVPVVLDPTMLLDEADWASLAEPMGVQDPYLFCYFLGEGRWYRDYAKALSARLGLRLVLLSRDPMEAVSLGAIDLSQAGPAQFLDLVRNAACVITDSYHGTLFSINFGRPFLVVERPGSNGTQSMSSRIHSVLASLSLEDRLLRESDYVRTALPPVPDGQSVRKLEALRGQSRDFLGQALQKVLS